jgi:hypothetical protein
VLGLDVDSTNYGGNPVAIANYGGNPVAIDIVDFSISIATVYC